MNKKFLARFQKRGTGYYWIRVQGRRAVILQENLTHGTQSITLSPTNRRWLTCSIITYFIEKSLLFQFNEIYLFRENIALSKLAPLILLYNGHIGTNPSFFRVFTPSKLNILLHLFLRFFFSFLAILLRSKFREKLPSVGVTPQMACLYVFVATNLARSRIKSYFSQLQENVSLGKPSKFNKGGPHSYSFHFPSIGNVPLLPCLGVVHYSESPPGKR